MTEAAAAVLFDLVQDLFSGPALFFSFLPSSIRDRDPDLLFPLPPLHRLRMLGVLDRAVIGTIKTWAIKDHGSTGPDLSTCTGSTFWTLLKIFFRSQHFFFEFLEPVPARWAGIIIMGNDTPPL
jgi:hypothetical protein